LVLVTTRKLSAKLESSALVGNPKALLAITRCNPIQARHPVITALQVITVEIPIMTEY
jgi:hypothetical protein